jgi:hypothetical protein
MATHVQIAQLSTGNVETKPARSAAPHKPLQDSRARAYWGDRFTIKFWLFCFAVMAGMNLVEAFHRIMLYLLGTP